LQRSYDGFLTRMLQAPTAVFVGAGVVLLLGLAALPLFKQQSLLPAFKERQLLVHWEGAPGSSHPAMIQMASKVAQELRTLPGVSKVAGHVGRAVLADQVVGINSAQLWVSIDRGANYSQTVAAIQETIEGYPGLNQGVRSYIRESLSQALSGSSEAMVVRIFGPEFAVLRSKAEEVRQDLSRIKGIVDLRLESPVEQSAVEVKVDLAKAERYGLKPGDVRRAAATLMNGLEVGSLFENQKVFQVVVWSTPQKRNNLTAIREMLLDTPRGGHVRLEELADIRIAPALHTINREAISRRVEVGFNVRGRDLGAVAREVQERLRSTAFPLEYHAVVLGEYTERQAVQQRIWIAGVVALLAMLFLLQAVLQSWRLAWLVLVSLPVALCGGVLVAFLVQGGVFTLGFLAGLLALLGIAVRNNVLLIAHYRHLEQTEGLTFSRELALRGAKERLVPTLMTAAAIALALLPFALTGSVAGLEVGQPMALVVLGGLVTTTLVNVWLMPALFLRFGVEPEPEMGLAPVAAGAAGGG
jgi:Cu/Ag efflux pump CusA